MINKGIQNRRLEYSSRKLLEEIGNISGVIDEHKAKYYLYKLFRNNPNLAAKWFLGVDLFPFQTMMLKGMFIGDYSMFVLPRGCGKCGKLGELVATENGFKEIQDVSVGEKVKSLYNFNTVKEKTINTPQTVYNIKTKSGFESGGLDYHRFLSFNPKNLDFEWSYAKDASVGDTVVIHQGVKHWPKRKELRQNNYFNRPLEDWYYFWGLIIGDGWYLKGKNRGRGIGFCSSDKELADWVENFLIDTVGRCSKRFDRNCHYVNIIDKDLVEWMTSIGFDFSKNAHEKIIPYQVIQNEKNLIKEILRGLYDTDGYCSTTTNKKGYLIAEVGYTSNSPKLINQVKNLLLNFGIQPYTTEKKFKNKVKFPTGHYHCRTAWSICISTANKLKLFNQEIGFKLARKQLILNKSCAIQKNIQDIKIPCADYIFRKYGRWHKKTAGLNLSCPSKAMTKSKLRKLYDAGIFDEIDAPKIKKILELDVYYDSVKDVEIKPDTITVDLQVENEHCYYSNGFISHNTFLAGNFILLDMLLNNSNIGVISSVFRASKLTLQKAETIMNSKNADMARAAGYKLSGGTDQWTMTLGNGKTLALPLGDGQRLRGFRFSRLMIDEFLNVPKKAFEEVIMPFISSNEDAFNRQKYVDMEDQLIAAGKMTEDERRVWPSNKLILLSSPSFKFEYMYEVYSKYIELIEGKRRTFVDDGEEDEEKTKDAYRLVYQMQYDLVPKQLYDIRLLKQARQTMSEMNFKREFGAQFVDESDGFFKLSKMNECTIDDGDYPAVEVVGEVGAKYVLAIDPNASETDTADNFAMLLFKLNHSRKRATIVHAYAIAGLSFKNHINYLKYLLTHFNIVGMCVDQYGGGDQFVKACNESAVFKEANLKIGFINGTFNHLEEYREDLLEFKRSYNLDTKNICYLRAPTTTWINNANTQLQASIDHKKVWFGSRAIDDHLKKLMKKDFPIERLDWNLGIQRESGDNEQLKFNFIENLKDLVEQTKIECANIEVKSTSQGHLSFNLAAAFKNTKGPNRPRKDLYSCLVLGNWFIKTYFDALDVQDIKPQAGFTPFAI